MICVCGSQCCSTKFGYRIVDIPLESWYTLRNFINPFFTVCFFLSLSNVSTFFFFFLNCNSLISLWYAVSSTLPPFTSIFPFFYETIINIFGLSVFFFDVKRFPCSVHFYLNPSSHNLLYWSLVQTQLPISPSSLFVFVLFFVLLFLTSLFPPANDDVTWTLIAYSLCPDSLSVPFQLMFPHLNQRKHKSHSRTYDQM